MNASSGKPGVLAFRILDYGRIIAYILAASLQQRVIRFPHLLSMSEATQFVDQLKLVSI